MKYLDVVFAKIKFVFCNLEKGEWLFDAYFLVVSICFFIHELYFSTKTLVLDVNSMHSLFINNATILVFRI